MFNVVLRAILCEFNSILRESCKTIKMQQNLKVYINRVLGFHGILKVN